MSSTTEHTPDTWCGVPGCPCGGKEGFERRRAEHTVGHTPGPWHTEFIRGDLYSYDILASNGDLVVDRVSQANARLIAAAPEMLEALRGMLEWARRVRQPNPGTEIANAITAIAKAEGRS